MEFDTIEVEGVILITIRKPGYVNPTTDWVARIKNFRTPNRDSWRFLEKQHEKDEKWEGTTGVLTMRSPRLKRECFKALRRFLPSQLEHPSRRTLFKSLLHLFRCLDEQAFRL